MPGGSGLPILSDTPSGARLSRLQRSPTIYHLGPSPSRYDNLPRKRAKFINFTKRALDLDAEIAESLWSLIEAPAADVPTPVVTEDPVTVAAPAAAVPKLVSHQAPPPSPPTSCGLVSLLMRRMGVTGFGRTGVVQPPLDSNEPVGGGLDGWSAGLNAEDQATKEVLPIPVNLPPPSCLPFKGAQPAKQSTSTPAPPFMRGPSTDPAAAPRAAPPTTSPNFVHMEITLLKPSKLRQERLGSAWPRLLCPCAGRLASLSGMARPEREAKPH